MAQIEYKAGRNTDKDSDNHQLAMEQFKVSADAEDFNRVEGLDDLKFAYGEQWPDGIAHQRSIDARPCITINKVLTFIKKVVNEARLNKPSIKVRPVDDETDVEKADVISGLIRQIQKQSDADTAFTTAYEGSVTNGFGYFRVCTDYVSEESNDQEINFKRITNPFTVYFDPKCEKIDYSDARYCFVSEYMPRKEFEIEYPDAVAVDVSEVAVGDDYNNWYDEDSVRIAEWFNVEYKDDVLYEIEDPTEGEITIFKSEYDRNEYSEEAGYTIYRDRPVKRRVVIWRMISGTEILEEMKWPGYYIPVIPVLGRQADIEGCKRLYSLTRFAKDPARMYNYWKTTETELLTLAPKTPFVGAEGQFEGHENKWNAVNTQSVPYLEYKPVTIGGQLAPPPKREQFAGVPTGVVNASLEASNDIKEVTGIDDPKLGNVSADISGVAINSQRSESEQVNYDFLDNLSKSIRHAGRVLVDLIPKIYDTERVVQILGEDDAEEIVKINSESPDKDGNLYDLSVGKYDVKIETGPSYATRRQEAAAGMSNFVTNLPEAARVIPDLIAKSQDWPEADVVAERLKKTVPPEILGDELDEENASVIIAQQQQEIASLSSQFEQAMQIINQQQITKETTLENTQLKEAGATQREIIKSKTDLATQKIDTDGELKEEQIKAQADIITALINKTNELTTQVEVLSRNVIDNGSQPSQPLGING